MVVVLLLEPVALQAQSDPAQVGQWSADVLGLEMVQHGLPRCVQAHAGQRPRQPQEEKPARDGIADPSRGGELRFVALTSPSPIGYKLFRLQE